MAINQRTKDKLALIAAMREEVTKQHEAVRACVIGYTPNGEYIRIHPYNDKMAIQGSLATLIEVPMSWYYAAAIDRMAKAFDMLAKQTEQELRAQKYSRANQNMDFLKGRLCRIRNAADRAVSHV
jgi:hypothetical protein